MAAIRRRENTFKVDLSNFPKKPSYEVIHNFLHGTIGLECEQVLRLQMNHAQNCAHVKCVDLQTAQNIVDNHSEKHQIQSENQKITVRLQMEDGGVEVKIHDLSENISNEEIEIYLNQFGEVHSIKEQVWGSSYAFKSINTGVRIAKMTLRRHIKSFVTILGEQTLVSYRNQPQTCRHCTQPLHPGSSCVQNKKLLGQKAELNKRLESARNSSSASAPRSYANVVANADAAAKLLPNFLQPASTSNNKRENSSMHRQVIDPPATDRTDSSDPKQSEDESVTHIAPMDTVEADHIASPLDVRVVVEDIALSATMPQTQSLKKVSEFKTPYALSSSTNIPHEISESDASSSENGMGTENQSFRRRGRQKKQKLDIP